MNIFDQISPHQWEYFAGYYLNSCGYTILEQPSVGPDKGKDLIVELNGVKCLVSCKHYSRSQRSVLARNEKSVPDRLIQHEAKKFIGFYSTSASCSLLTYLKDSEVNYLILDGQTVLDNLSDVSFSVHQSLFRNIRSFKRKTFGQEYRPLLCKCGCGEDLISDENSQNSTVCLSRTSRKVEIVWLLNGHSYNDSRRISILTTISECFSLANLNMLIDRYDQLLGNDLKVSHNFDKEYTEFLEVIHQMVHPID